MGKSRHKIEREREARRRDRRHVYLICALLILATLAVYWQVAGFDFTNIDDELYVKLNPFIADGLTPARVQWSLTTTYNCIWMPLVWMSYMVDHDVSSRFSSFYLGNADPHVCHATNLLLHVVNVVLLFLVLASMTRRTWLSAFVAALFAVHPLHVESVAWIAERKDVLSTLFWLLTMLAYVRYVRKPGLWRYALVLLAFALGLMSKPMIVTLPAALLILDYWPLDRLGTGEHRISFLRALREKIPMFVLAIPCVIVTITSAGLDVASAAGDHGIIHPLGVRLANAFVSYVQYIVMMFWPRNLAVLYPHPGNSLPVWQVVGSVLILAVICIFALRAARTRPYVTAGWLWYVLTLIPVIGLAQVGKIAYADRFTYVPLIGLFIAIAWGASDLLERLRGFASATIVAAGLAVGLIITLMVCSYIQVGYWRDSYTVLSHAVRVTGPNAQARHALGLALASMGKPEEAINQYRESLRIDSQQPDAMHRLGCLLVLRGRPADLDEAIRLFQASLKLYPESELTHNVLGIALARRGRLDEAIVQFREALRINPHRTEAQGNLDRALALKRKQQ